MELSSFTLSLSRAMSLEVPSNLLHSVNRLKESRPLMELNWLAQSKF